MLDESKTMLWGIYFCTCTSGKRRTEWYLRIKGYICFIYCIVPAQRPKVTVVHLLVVNKKVLACCATVYNNWKNPVP